MAIGLDHHFCSPEEIAGASIGPDALPLAREAAIRAGAEEVFILSTCNRVEAYVCGSLLKSYQACHDALSLGGKRPHEPGKFKSFQNLEAVEHLFEVASGIDSQMIGENEILGQIKSAYSAALNAGLGPVLSRTVQKAIQCAKWVRTNTGIGSGNTTIGAVVAELASRIFDDFSKKKILLAGSGEVGKSVAMALAARGAKEITVSSRTWENAYALSNDVGGSAIGFERIKGALSDFDIAIFALSNAPEVIDYGTAFETAKARKSEPFFMVDLGVPQNVSKKADEIGTVFLYDLEDLSKQANENLELRMGEIDRAKTEIAKRAGYLWGRLSNS